MTSEELFNELYRNNQNALSRLQANGELEIIEAYGNASASIRTELKNIYDKYAKDGVLSNGDKTTYNRLKSLNKRIEAYLKDKEAEVEELIYTLTEEQYEEAFYRMAHTIDESGQVSIDWGVIDHNTIEKFVKSPLDKLYKSKSIVAQRDWAFKKIKSDITNSLIRGDSFDTLSRRIGKTLGAVVSKNGKTAKYTTSGLASKAMRIARTEGMRALNQGHLDAYARAREAGCNIVEVWDATLDSRTRPSHGALDGQEKHYMTEDDENEGWFVPELGAYVSGPGQSGIASFDINCRCRITAHVKDYPTEERRVRGEGITSYRTYREWKNANPAYDSKSLSAFSRKNPSFKEVRKKAIKEAPEAILNIQKAAAARKTPRYLSGKRSYCDFDGGFIGYNLDDFSTRAYWHEMGHWVDYTFGITKDIKIEIQKMQDAFRSELRAAEWTNAKELQKVSKNLISKDENYRALSDFLYILSEGEIKGRWGHYGIPYEVADELWANMFSIFANSNKGGDLIEKYVPNLYNLFKEKLEVYGVLIK